MRAGTACQQECPIGWRALGCSPPTATLSVPRRRVLRPRECFTSLEYHPPNSQVMSAFIYSYAAPVGRADFCFFFFSPL
jgi:hypothetical protein